MPINLPIGKITHLKISSQIYEKYERNFGWNFHRIVKRIFRTLIGEGEKRSLDKFSRDGADLLQSLNCRKK